MEEENELIEVELPYSLVQVVAICIEVEWPEYSSISLGVNSNRDTFTKSQDNWFKSLRYGKL
jgi:hypothetical protein